jgi:hypothetical protein
MKNPEETMRLFRQNAENPDSDKLNEMLKAMRELLDNPDGAAPNPKHKKFEIKGKPCFGENIFAAQKRGPGLRS